MKKFLVQLYRIFNFAIPLMYWLFGIYAILIERNIVEALLWHIGGTVFYNNLILRGEVS